MRLKLYSTIVLLMSLGAMQAQQTLDNFEDIRKGTYGFINGTFIPYTGNPDATGENTSRVVATYTRNPVEEFDVILLDAPLADISGFVDGTKQMSIKVWSPAVGTTVQITLEDSDIAMPDNFPIGRHSVYLATTTVAEQWETLTFTFDNRPDGDVADDAVERIVLLFAPGTFTGDTYYFDDLVGPELASDPCADVTINQKVFNDFECQQNIDFTFSHSGVNFRRVVNPDQTGNESDYCGSYVRNAGEENDVIVALTDGAIDLSEDIIVELDVWDSNSPTDIVLSFQFEDENGMSTTVLDVTATTLVTGEWTTIGFSVLDILDAQVNKLVILFDPGNFSSDQYYFDNLQLGTATSISEISNFTAFSAFPNPASGPVTFDYTLETASDVTISVFNNVGVEVDRIMNTRQRTGDHRVEWNTNDLPAGVYFYTFTVDGQVGTGKIILAR